MIVLKMCSNDFKIPVWTLCFRPLLGRSNKLGFWQVNRIFFFCIISSRVLYTEMYTLLHSTFYTHTLFCCCRLYMDEIKRNDFGCSILLRWRDRMIFMSSEWVSQATFILCKHSELQSPLIALRILRDSASFCSLT